MSGNISGLNSDIQVSHLHKLGTMTSISFCWINMDRNSFHAVGSSKFWNILLNNSYIEIQQIQNQQ